MLWYKSKIVWINMYVFKNFNYASCTGNQWVHALTVALWDTFENLFNAYFNQSFWKDMPPSKHRQPYWASEQNGALQTAEQQQHLLWYHPHHPPPPPPASTYSPYLENTYLRGHWQRDWFSISSGRGRRMAFMEGEEEGEVIIEETPCLGQVSAISPT